MAESTPTPPAVPVIFDRALWVARRDRAAPQFEACDYLLARVMEDIIDRLAFIARDFREVLVLGAHDGSPARALRQALPASRITSSDWSAAMLARCEPPVVRADEERLAEHFDVASFDAVIAPLTLQYVNDLPGALRQIRDILRPDGLFIGVVPGGRNLEELGAATLVAEIEVRGGGSPRVAPRIDVRDLGSLLQRAKFALPVTDSDTVTVTFATALDLMRDLRAMGAGHCLAERARVPMTRGLLMRAAQIYADRFAQPDGRIPATFEFLTMTAWAPHPDQQRPLKPGSASHRLADFLGTQEHPAGDKTGT